MYNEYFGLRDAPFSIAPNPQFLYMSERHREALAHLLYGIKSDGGFILLTGEVGTGKTTVCRCLLEQVPEDVDTAFVLNPKLTAAELLATVCDDLAIDYPPAASIKVLVDRLNAFLLDSFKQGRRTVLIIDEAQNLSIDVLEQLRLLTNLETNERKLLQIILLGQPELLEMLAKPELRQLAQRVTARFHLDALGRDEVSAYIQHRLDIAGSHGHLFQPGAVNRIYALSGGIPRLINLICDRALLGAWTQDKLQVDKQTVDQAAREIFGKVPATQKRRSLSLAMLALLAIASTGTWLAYSPIAQQSQSTQQTGSTSPAQPAKAFTEEATTAPKTEGNNELMATTADAGLKSQTTANADAPETAGTTAKPDPAPQPDALIDVAGDDSQRDAMSTLFKVWGAPVAFDGASPCAQAPRVGLACLSALGSLRDMRELDRPAMVRLNIAGIENYVVVRRIDDANVSIQSSQGRYLLTRKDFIHTWNGEFLVLWQPPPDFRVIKQGDKGVTVDLLANKLAKIEGETTEAAVGITFDKSLTDKLKRFQITAGLKPDGIAGQNTWIHINTLLDDSVPRLSREGTS